ncbi:MAG: tetratricopeptide repeat protein [Prevotellaceae bacterium]|nr:tetratricopeptide repeat protein [Prevotellaceae bacterium]
MDKKINRLFLLFFWAPFFLIPVGGRAAVADSLWTQANAFYANGQYPDAARLYAEIEATNSISPELYFNMGNACYKQNELARAILCYERALRLAPNDAAIAYNLEMAQLRTLDRIDILPAFFLTEWFRNLRHMAGADTWAMLSLVMLAATLLFFGFFLFFRSVRSRKASFFMAIAFGLLAVLTVTFAFYRAREAADRSEAIVFPAVVTVKSAPDNTGKDLFILHEGAKVTIIDELAGWQNIRLLDGKEGWIEAGNTERI